MYRHNALDSSLLVMTRALTYSITVFHDLINGFAYAHDSHSTSSRLKLICLDKLLIFFPLPAISIRNYHTLKGIFSRSSTSQERMVPGLKSGDRGEDIGRRNPERHMVSSSSSSSLDSEVPGQLSGTDKKKNSVTDVGVIGKQCTKSGYTTNKETSKAIEPLASSSGEIVQPLPLITLSHLAAEAVIQHENPLNKNISKQLTNTNELISKKSNSLTMLSSENMNLNKKILPTTNFALLQKCRSVQRKRSESFDSSRNSFSPLRNNISNLRRGKWTSEEETYVARVIRDFNYGYLDAPAGTTLRTYLSGKLHCDPMRITKKFTGDSCIGKRVFHPAVRCANNAEAIDKAQVLTLLHNIGINYFIQYLISSSRFFFYRQNFGNLKNDGECVLKCNNAKLPKRLILCQFPQFHSKLVCLCQT